MILDEHFWLAVAFVLFAVLVARYVLPMLLRSLDDKSKLIADEIAAAQKMKEDAKNLLESAEEYYRESVAFAQKILKDAEEESKRTAELAKKALEDEVNKKTTALMNRLKTEEESAIRQLKSHIIDAAIQNLYSNVSREMSEQDHNQVLAKATSDLERN